jgi:high-affinity Fe2+/Pb2+ permease
MNVNATSERVLLGLALLGFTSVYREGFEIVIFLQNLRELFVIGDGEHVHR